MTQNITEKRLGSILIFGIIPKYMTNIIFLLILE